MPARAPSSSPPMPALLRQIFIAGYASYLAAGWLFLSPAGQAARLAIVDYIRSL